MFCADLLLLCPWVEISISQKILQNVLMMMSFICSFRNKNEKFAMMIADQDMTTINCVILRENGRDLPASPAGKHGRENHKQLSIQGYLTKHACKSRAQKLRPSQP
jgi:hypothetical protein